jgi:hypothetical protein
MESYKEFFENNTEEQLVNAVKNGMHVYRKNYADDTEHAKYAKYARYETFFEAAVRYGSPALVDACIDMGADVNCVDPQRARHTSPRAVTSSLVCAIEARNPKTLRTLIERGARTEILKDLNWRLEKNFIPEAEYDEEARKVKQRLDTGSAILKILRNVGFRIPGADVDDEELSVYSVGIPSQVWWGRDEEGSEDAEKLPVWEDWDEYRAYDEDEYEIYKDEYCEGAGPDLGEYSFPSHGIRPGALWHAASPAALKAMIEAGGDVNAADAAGWSAIHHIAFDCDFNYYFNPDAMLQTLIDAGADVNARGRYGMRPLHLAGMRVLEYPRALETVKLLARNGADSYALDYKSNGIVFWVRDYWCNAIFVKLMLQEILFEICRSVQAVQAGKAKHVYANKQGGASPLSAADLDLMTAAFWGTAKDLAPVLARGANIHARSRHGYTPLMFASTWNGAPAIEFLVGRGADMSAKNIDEETPLTLALQSGDPLTVKALVTAGASPAEADKWGRTPLTRGLSDALSEYGLKPRARFRDVFADNGAKEIAAAVENGLDLSLKDAGSGLALFLKDKDADREDFLTAALRYGTAEVARACVKAYINMEGRWKDYWSEWFHELPFAGLYRLLYAAVALHNADAVEFLLKPGAWARSEDELHWYESIPNTLKMDIETFAEHLKWDERPNISPKGAKKAGKRAPDSGVEKFLTRIDAGARILRLLREAGADVPDGGKSTYVSVEYSLFPIIVD